MPLSPILPSRTPSSHPVNASTAIAVSGTRAVLAKKADRRISSATSEILQLVNGPSLQQYLPGAAVGLRPTGVHLCQHSLTQVAGPCLELRDGQLCPLEPLLPDTFAAFAAYVNRTSLRRQLFSTGIVAAATVAVGVWVTPWLAGIGVCATALNGLRLVATVFAKLHVAVVQQQAARVQELVGEIRDWSQRKEDAMDTRGPNLQSIVEERRQRSVPHPLQAPLNFF